MMVGQTYTIQLQGGTAPQGYNQFEDFINFPNFIFQILSVETTYSVGNSVTGPAYSPYDYLYADACGWDNDRAAPPIVTVLSVMKRLAAISLQPPMRS